MSQYNKHWGPKVFYNGLSLILFHFHFYLKYGLWTNMELIHFWDGLNFNVFYKDKFILYTVFISYYILYSYYIIYCIHIILCTVFILYTVHIIYCIAFCRFPYSGLLPCLSFGIVRVCAFAVRILYDLMPIICAKP